MINENDELEEDNDDLRLQALESNDTVGNSDQGDDLKLKGLKSHEQYPASDDCVMEKLKQLDLKRIDSIDVLRSQIKSTFTPKHGKKIEEKNPAIRIYYEDADKDIIQIINQEDLEIAKYSAEEGDITNLQLFISVDESYPDMVASLESSYSPDNRSILRDLTMDYTTLKLEKKSSSMSNEDKIKEVKNNFSMLDSIRSFHNDDDNMSFLFEGNLSAIGDFNVVDKQEYERLEQKLMMKEMYIEKLKSSGKFEFEKTNHYKDKFNSESF